MRSIGVLLIMIGFVHAILGLNCYGGFGHAPEGAVLAVSKSAERISSSLTVDELRRIGPDMGTFQTTSLEEQVRKELGYGAINGQASTALWGFLFSTGAGLLLVAVGIGTLISASKLPGSVNAT